MLFYKNVCAVIKSITPRLVKRSTHVHFRTAESVRRENKRRLRDQVFGQTERNTHSAANKELQTHMGFMMASLGSTKTPRENRQFCWWRHNCMLYVCPKIPHQWKHICAYKYLFKDLHGYGLGTPCY